MSFFTRSIVLIIPMALAAHAVCGQASATLPVSYICIEAETGMVLLEKDADVVRPPASMLKMMQMLLVEEGVQSGLWTYETPIGVSRLAQSMGGTQVYLAAGEEWPLGRLLTAIAVASANDASVAVAEGLWGSVGECLKAMNQRAADLGMTNTFFYSVNGLPPSDGVSFDQSSARDMATLGRTLTAYPRLLELTSVPEFGLRPENSARKNTNQLLGRMPGCDGLKTGYIRAAGFCLTATAMRENIRLIAVVMGSDRSGRFTHTQEVLEEGFTLVQRVEPVVAGARIGKGVAVRRGLDPDVGLRARDSIGAVVLKADLDRLLLEVTAPAELEAPIVARTEVGVVRLVLEGRVLGESPLLTAESVERKRWQHRLSQWVGLDTQ